LQPQPVIKFISYKLEGTGSTGWPAFITPRSAVRSRPPLRIIAHIATNYGAPSPQLLFVLPSFCRGRKTFTQNSSLNDSSLLSRINNLELIQARPWGRNSHGLRLNYWYDRSADLGTAAHKWHVALFDHQAVSFYFARIICNENRVRPGTCYHSSVYTVGVWGSNPTPYHFFT